MKQHYYDRLLFGSNSGQPAYGIHVNESKTLVNYPLSIGDVSINDLQSGSDKGDVKICAYYIRILRLSSFVPLVRTTD